MIDTLHTLLTICRVLLAFIPFFLFVLSSNKTNLKKTYRDRQLLMPLVAIFYCIFLAAFNKILGETLVGLFSGLGNLLSTWGELLSRSENIAFLGQLIMKLGALIAKAVKKLDANYLSLVMVNTFALLAFYTIKAFAIAIMKASVKPGTALHDNLAVLFYEPNQDPNVDFWFLRRSAFHLRTYVHTFYISAAVIAVISMAVSVALYENEVLSAMFYPAYAVIILGEIYFFLDGYREEENSGFDVEEDNSRSSFNYDCLRKYLRRLFKDKLIAEDCTASAISTREGTEQLLTSIERDENPHILAYAQFMRSRMQLGHELDPNYLSSGLDLVRGHSVLFNDPFYYDLIPYAFFAMDRTLLRRKKVMIIAGRHGAEGDLAKWCEEGFFSVSGVPGLWNIGILGDQTSSLDVGIVTRSDVNNRRMFEANRDFLEQVGFVFLVEPSKLITTAQVGLNSLIRQCREFNKSTITYCSVDKNCDGLLDALSHVLMTDLREVTATNKQSGNCSYMCWASDEEYWQHRMLPNIAHYLGIGTELSFVALKNQVSHTVWYGGETFPVIDMRWIVRQYYFTLLKYADLPINQENIDKYFQVSANPSNERVCERNYITVEDESYNMFEVKRTFSTRADSECFINVISSNYLLRDYMASNNEIFDTDPKAIPSIVADYAKTRHNAVLRLCLQMASGYLREKDLRNELIILNGHVDNITADFWKEICRCCGAVANGDKLLYKTLTLQDETSTVYTFDQSTIRTRRDYCIESGQMENIFYLSDKLFNELLLSGLQNASYMTEDETGAPSYLGSELLGHIYQKLLPGQFFTFCGKYYEMVSVTPNNKVVVRRASDHITGRPEYRQVRNYTIHAAMDSPEMGACKTVGKMRLTLQYADFSVSTPAYWQMENYNDFFHGKKVVINGVPDRIYHNKQILRIDFGDDTAAFNEPVCRTLTLLMNEAFRSLFAENQDYIVALCVGEADAPLTYGLQGTDGFEPMSNAIYIIEDSQLDIGLLVAAERNIHRILSIVCDWLAWHKEQLSAKNEPEEQLAEPTEAPSPTDLQPRKKKNPFERIWDKIKNFFGRIFKGKKKEKKPKDKKTGETPFEDNPPREKPVKEKKMREKKKKKRDKNISPSAENESDLTQPPAPSDDADVQEYVYGETAAPYAESPAEPPVEEVPGSEEHGQPESADVSSDEAAHDDTPVASDSPAASDEPVSSVEPIASDETKDFEIPSEGGDTERPVVMLNIGFNPKRQKVNASVQPINNKDDDELTERPLSEDTVVLEDSLPAETVPTEDILHTPPAEDTEVPAEAVVTEESVAEAEVPAEDTVAEEPAAGFDAPTETSTEESAVPVQPTAAPAELRRKPYRERHYLLYGGTETPSMLDVDSTLDFLQELGYTNGPLQQARAGKDLADLIAGNYDPNDPNAHFCDFCGVEISGVEYDRLADGRERCPQCSRTAIRSTAECEKIYKQVYGNMQDFFHIRFTAPIHVKIVNAKTLHKMLKLVFIPTDAADGRVLGCAIYDKKKKYYTILLENGTPKISGIRTLAHELTHIWQYLNWNESDINSRYGKDSSLEIYEGMAEWVGIQYLYLIGEAATAKRATIINSLRNDEYGRGFMRFVEAYPLSTKTKLIGYTPFHNVQEPI